MNSSIHKFLIAGFMTLSLAACNKSDSGNGGPDLRPLNVDSKTVAGAWQVEAILANGQTYQQQGSAVGEIYQLDITSSRIAIVTSKNGQVTERQDSTYTLENGKIVTKDTRRQNMADLEILLVTASTMQVRPYPQTGGVIYQWNLRRIDPSLVVGGSNNTGGGTGANVEQFIQMDMATPSLKFSKLYKKIGNVDATSNDFVDLSCNYKPNVGVFEINLTTYRKNMDGRNQSQSQSRNTESQVTLRGRVDMDLSKYEEAVNFTIERGRSQQRPGFVAEFNPPRARAIYFSLGREGRCEVSLNRQDGVVNFNGSCARIDANGDDRSDGRSRMSLRGTCVLQ